MKTSRTVATIHFLASLLIFVLTSTFWLIQPASAALTSSQSASVGVVVEPSEAEPPPTSEVPKAPLTRQPVVTVPATVPDLEKVDSGSKTSIPTPNSLVQELQNVREQPPTRSDQGVVENMGQAAAAAMHAAKQIFKGIAAGKPVAQVLEEVLPGPVGDVVVPAVRTASTFAFPIGLAAAVVGFLALQNRVDSSDPKLTAAPFAHDDDVVEFI